MAALGQKQTCAMQLAKSAKGQKRTRGQARSVTLNVKCLFQIGASATAVRLGGGSK